MQRHVNFSSLVFFYFSFSLIFFLHFFFQTPTTLLPILPNHPNIPSTFFLIYFLFFSFLFLSCLVFFFSSLRELILQQQRHASNNICFPVIFSPGWEKSFRRDWEERKKKRLKKKSMRKRKIVSHERVDMQKCFYKRKRVNFLVRRIASPPYRDRWNSSQWLAKLILLKLPTY